MELVKQEQQLISYNDDQVKLIRSMIAPKATDNELKLFLYQCQRTGLDPLTRQIYAIHRKSGNEDKMTIQTSIDGFRVIAERSGVYAGQSEPEFVEGEGFPKLCKITVRKFAPNGTIYDAAVGVAYWDEYVQTKDEWKNGQKTGKKIVSDMWAKMPHTMLSKVAEALALRKAFPQDLSGLYTGEEMNQADTPTTVDVPAEVQTVGKITIKEAAGRNEEIKAAVKDLLDCTSVEHLKSLKAQLPDYVIKNESFKEAATQRFTELTESKTLSAV